MTRKWQQAISVVPVNLTEPVFCSVTSVISAEFTPEVSEISNLMTSAMTGYCSNISHFNMSAWTICKKKSICPFLASKRQREMILLGKLRFLISTE